MDNFKIFIVEDDPFYGRLLQHHLSMNPDYEVSVYTNGNDVLKNLHLAPDVICVDFGLPDMTGDKLLAKVKQYDANLPVIVISGQDEISVAVDLLKKGARDYIIKGDNTNDLLWRSIINVREHSNLKQEVAQLKEQLGEKHSFESIIGKSEVMKRVFTLMKKALSTSINVSIVGETGTGKEVVAKAIHYNSERKKMPFVPVNMAAIPKELIESELFGHVKGAFTGASNNKVGKFESADGGTLFLDEIGELDINVQSKLLRAIQEREFTRVGDNKIKKFNVRIITATHKDLQEEVKTGRFREDLYFRLMGFPIPIPPLRERDEDIILLANYFIDIFTKENNLSELNLSRKAKDKLMKYAFPGNVRELKAMIDLSCVMAEGKTIHEEDIRPTNLRNDLAYSSEEKTLKEYNFEIINSFLKKYDQNVVLVSKKLDIGKSTIYNLLKENKVKKD